MTTEAGPRVRLEPCAKRVRAYLGGELVVDSRHVTYVWENRSYPAYYFPRQDVRMELLRPSDRVGHSPARGEATYYDVAAGDRLAPAAAWSYPESPLEDLRTLLRLEWGAMDAWFEEDEEVIVHPRDPYTRVDILSSSRHVRIEINGITVAESVQPRMLFETGLPVRYYLPVVDLRRDLLRSSAKVSQCPYKGTAAYWSVQAGDVLATDVVWTYRTPLAECTKIAGLAAFYNERVDLHVDGELQERP